MKKLRWLFILFIIIGVFVAFTFLYNPSISVGYSEGIVKNEAKDYPFEGRVGILLKKTRYNIKDKVTAFFSYGYYKEEKYKDFHVLIFVEDEDKGMVAYLDQDIDNFYSDDYQVIKPSIFNGDLKYAKYENIEIDFNEYKSGKIAIVLSCVDENNQTLQITQKISYEVKNGKVTFKK